MPPRNLMEMKQQPFGEVEVFIFMIHDKEIWIWKQHQEDISPIIQEVIVSLLGDSTMMSTRSVEILLKLTQFCGSTPMPNLCAPTMMTLKSGVCGNRTLCLFISVKLKDGTQLCWKKWDWMKVNTVWQWIELKLNGFNFSIGQNLHWINILHVSFACNQRGTGTQHFWMSRDFRSLDRLDLE